MDSNCKGEDGNQIEDIGSYIIGLCTGMRNVGNASNNAEGECVAEKQDTSCRPHLQALVGNLFSSNVSGDHESWSAKMWYGLKPQLVRESHSEHHQAPCFLE